MYPTNDLFPAEPIRLYEQLGDICNIDIFGMSPYGDEDLIKMLNKMNNVTVFVHNKEKNVEEVEKWDKVLTCKHAIRDSAEL